MLPIQLPNLGPRELPPHPEYSEKDIAWMSKLPMAQVKDGWWRDMKNNIILPEAMGQEVLERIHQTTHLGSRWLQDLMRQSKLSIRNVVEKSERIATGCAACQLQNACPHSSITES